MRVKGALAAIGIVGLLALLSPVGLHAQTLQSCGNEGEPLCAPSLFNYVCDTGLDVSAQTCGCLLRGVFGNCLIPRICVTCEDLTRRRRTFDGFGATWTDWALKNQRDLAQDEPMNWVLQLGSHNSFNTLSDGHLINFPNHFYSMTDQLRAGARFLSIDTHFVPYNNGPARLCHGGNLFSGDPCVLPGNNTIYPFFPPGMRYFANGIKEIRNWLGQNRNEIVIVAMEDYVKVAAQGGADADVLDPIATYLGRLALRSPLTAPAGFNQERWPTRREMLAAGRRVIVLDDAGIVSSFLFKQQNHVIGSVEDWAAKNQRTYPDCTASPSVDVTAQAGSNRLTTMDDKFANGDRVKLTRTPAAPLPDGVNEDVLYYVVNYTSLSPTLLGFRIAMTAGGEPVDILGDGPATARVMVPAARFSVIAEDRSGIPTVDVGELDANAVAAAAECNINLITMDFFSSVLPDGKFFDAAEVSRQQAAIWSWTENDRGQNGDCAMLGASQGRWSSANCAVARRFACAQPRSESSLDPLVWADPLGEDWKITSAAGPWQDGHAVCRTEFPGYVFGVPVNGYQNRKLKDANAGGPDLWLNYSQRQVKGRWAIGRLSGVNSPPVADAGPDQVVQCGSTVTLNGSASIDSDGDPLTYSWETPFGTLTGPVVTATLPAGVHAIVLTVSDGKGGTDTDELTVTIRDTVAPVMTVSLTPPVLWPVNHGLVDIVARIEVSDGCDAEPLVKLVSITSNEAGAVKGAGQAQPDVAGADFGTDDREFRLRAERSGTGTGRIYTVKYRATDRAGNATEVAAQVTVPHDRSGRER